MPPDDSENTPPPVGATELPSYGMEEDAPTGWRAWLHGGRLLLLILLLVFAALAAFGAKPLYRELKARRALAIAERAGEALDAGNGAEASTLLRQAALMAFEDERVADRVTYFAARSGDMASVAALGRKMETGSASNEELLVFGERSLGAGRIADATRALEGLPAELPPAEAARRAALRAGSLLAKKNAGEALTTLRDAISTLPTGETDALRVMLANMLLSNEDTSGRAEAETLLEQAATNQGPEGASALRLLALSRAGISPDAQENLAGTFERLRNHPASSPSDELFIARLRISSDPSGKHTAIGDMVAQLKSREAPADVRVTAARWLIGQQANEAVLELIAPEEPSHHAGALMVRIDALSGLGRWEECGELIEANRGGTVPDTLYHLFRARIAESRNEATAAETEKRLLRQVVQFAELPHILFAARYAESVGWKPEAFAAWRILAMDKGAAAEGLRGQLRTLPNNMRASDGADIAAKLLEIQPNDASARLSAAYFRLMAGQMIDASAAAAEEFLKAQPDSADILRVAALARLRTGQAAKGLEIWPGDNNEPRWRALHAALLRAAGETRQAKAAAKDIDQDALNPDEQEFLRGL
ncbi:MAG: hypothetical protein IAE97_02590 [Chthoniobacterales bacterium]|nr:hypothetical protein [Chthoniobacterales bacterium]